MRPRHPNKEIEAAIQHAESNGWTIRKGQGHAWGVMYCMKGDRTGCQMSIASPPKDPDAHAKKIRRKVDKCPH